MQQQHQPHQQAAAALAASSSRFNTHGDSGSFSSSSGKQTLDIGPVFFSFSFFSSLPCSFLLRSFGVFFVTFFLSSYSSLLFFFSFFFTCFLCRPEDTEQTEGFNH